MLMFLKDIVLRISVAQIVKGRTHLLLTTVLFSFLIMNVLQLNIQSVNSSESLLRAAIKKNNVDLVLLQEIWLPKEKFGIHGFQPPILRTRKDNYGGVGIIARNSLKVVHRKEYEVSGLEATWVESCIPKSSSRILFGSIYINGGKLNQIALLDKALSVISPNHSSFILSMDANARNALWDASAPLLPLSALHLRWGRSF